MNGAHELVALMDKATAPSTASERRAAGEVAFCACATCVSIGAETMRMLSGTYPPPPDVNYTIAWAARSERDVPLAALLRALVVQTLLDPATWTRPEGWRP